MSEACPTTRASDRSFASTTVQHPSLQIWFQPRAYVHYEKNLEEHLKAMETWKRRVDAARALS